MHRKLMITALVAAGLARTVGADDPPPVPVPYNGIQAGLDAYALAEEQRRANVGQQLLLNDQLKYWAGLPTSHGESIYYYSYGGPATGAYPYATHIAPPANREFTYAYGDPRLWPRPYFGPRRGPLTVFEPWPYVPGDIYGYPYYTFAPVRQPIGLWQGQTGANRWESHPIYAPAAPPDLPPPPQDGKIEPSQEPIPPPPRRGPREY
jgi:hypothetical protein